MFFRVSFLQGTRKNRFWVRPRAGKWWNLKSGIWRFWGPPLLPLKKTVIYLINENNGGSPGFGGVPWTSHPTVRFCPQIDDYSKVPRGSAADGWPGSAESQDAFLEPPTKPPNHLWGELLALLNREICPFLKSLLWKLSGFASNLGISPNWSARVPLAVNVVLS